jgi:hypothetical protein
MKKRGLGITMYHYVFGRGLVEMKLFPEAVSHLTEAYILRQIRGRAETYQAR